MTNLVLYISVFILSWKQATLSYAVYLLLGIAGLPVFSGFAGGLAKVAGPTGGYLASFFIFLTILSGFVIQKSSGKYRYLFYTPLGSASWHGSHVCLWNILACRTDEPDLRTGFSGRSPSLPSCRHYKNRHCIGSWADIKEKIVQYPLNL